ncbi:glyceraldehyde 3-phosphate dehydrogenase [Lutibacter oricola]|uniref:Glyceraldehyde-3-phosphate dehydrogenase n=1 Tax=Lutibacter oricola TaxID=762486 RepID=A0A1H3C514_9FLAO|nr:type I glyceraldehyde-3-phosphate dehydrogenase [Lutibacter oricola]SDX48724.1 glyceraldehyde 3-phosphate dehydrogenase [Lutibacter oricola]
MIRVGINGFGRIGRIAFRSIINRNNVEIVAVNDLMSVEYIAYALKYDSVHGKFNGTVTIENNTLIVNGKRIRVTSESKPENIAWNKVNVDYVIESTGYFTDKNLASLHLKAGAKKVVISAPSKNAPMFVMGVNNHKLTKEDLVFSNASCTTNCLAPILNTLHNKFNIEEAMVTTVHCVTSSQNTVDGPKDSWRRGRAALSNMIPTTSSASLALTKIIPALKNKVLTMAVRVPVPDVSLVDITVKFNNPTSFLNLKEVIKKASENELKGILGYTNDEVVSQDFVSEPRISVFDASASMELNNQFFKIICWYDNEFGYATKLVDLIEYSNTIK